MLAIVFIFPLPPLIHSLNASCDFGEEADRYERLYYGAIHYTDEPSKEVLNPSETIVSLLQILREADGVDRERDIAVASASGRWRDYARILWRKFVSRPYE